MHKVCEGIIKTGKRSGEICLHKVIGGGLFCGYHDGHLSKLIRFEDKAIDALPVSDLPNIKPMSKDFKYISCKMNELSDQIKISLATMSNSMERHFEYISCKMNELSDLFIAELM